MKKTKTQNGITLIALIITIIVLLILAVVAISAIKNDGIMQYAQNARTDYTDAANKEQEDLDTLEGQIAAGINGESLGGGNETPVETISKEESFVGYYANIDSDEEPEGVIYADLAIGGSGQWGDSWGPYSYSSITGTKDYYVSGTYNGAFGEKPILTATGSGLDRFYVMALEDINSGTSYCWYDAAYGKLDKTVSTTANDFGAGRANSEYVMAKWDDASLPWGAHNDNGTYLDLWGVIKDKYEEGWFVPSKSEWSAFGDSFGITSSNYGNFGLSYYYWSSSQNSTNFAYNANFGDGYIGYGGVTDYNAVRLSATF